MCQRKDSYFSQLEIYILKIYYAKHDLDYMIPKGLARSHSQILNVFFRKGNYKFKTLSCSSNPYTVYCTSTEYSIILFCKYLVDIWEWGLDKFLGIHKAKFFLPCKNFMVILLKGTVSCDFLLLVFFVNRLPKPLIIALGSFRIFPKIRGDICKSRCKVQIWCRYHDTSGKFATNIASVIYTGGKFATGVHDTGGAS